jgi:hypothetical protein
MSVMVGAAGGPFCATGCTRVRDVDKLSVARIWKQTG